MLNCYKLHGNPLAYHACKKKKTTNTEVFSGYTSNRTELLATIQELLRLAASKLKHKRYAVQPDARWKCIGVCKHVWACRKRLTKKRSGS